MAVVPQTASKRKRNRAVVVEPSAVVTEPLAVVVVTEPLQQTKRKQPSSKSKSRDRYRAQAIATQPTAVDQTMRSGAQLDGGEAIAGAAVGGGVEQGGGEGSARRSGRRRRRDEDDDGGLGACLSTLEASLRRLEVSR